ncbi:uroporphyrinogen synthase [Microdochium bolleyi]|uniref:Uroporphyrinogen synthase n=1 Tax=Microdochium bolleyi TaxID=196109 RepID=A0A136J0W1_9PEZI|nr:uroporphyrinogen synthase [Microdochium bolleyi]
MASNQPLVPVLLLKTKSTPGDSYEDIFSSTKLAGHPGFQPIFVPVLQHQFLGDGMRQVRDLLGSRKIGNAPDCAYGGLIFTSQRAVEAFATLVQDDKGKGEQGWPHLEDVPVYSVGPATTRALKSVSQSPPLQIFGEHTGNGEALALFIQEHYTSWYSGRATLPPLLFLVGEQRRDIIPKTLMNPSLPANRRIEVTETVIYGTGVMESFPRDFADVLRESEGIERWVVVFSPTGCDSMLRGLGLLTNADAQQETPTTTKHEAAPKTYIATIGPTTRDHLKNNFGYEPDVCAEKPSPEGVLAGITGFDGRSR